MLFEDGLRKDETRHLHRRSLRATPSTAQAGADAGISWS